MEFLKNLFGAQSLTYDQFVQAANGAGVKLADLSSGGYVSKSKYDTDLASKDGQIQTLNAAISQRDSDLADVRSQLSAAGADAGKLSTLNTQLKDLQTKYDKDMQAYQDKLNAQAYEFAVKEYAGQHSFTSNAAKRDFINSMIAKGLQMEDGKLIGADDFKEAYSAENADAFSSAAGNKRIVGPTGGQNQEPPADFQTRLDAARKAGNKFEAIAIKREAAKEGIQLF